jgi:guanylate kinase
MSFSVKEVGKKPVLIVLCGPSHVGKTTFARRFGEPGENFAIISPGFSRQQV